MNFDKSIRTGPPRLFRLQVGLRHILLLTLCVGAWVANWTNQSQIAKLKPRLATLQKLAPELIVSDPSRIAIVLLDSKWYSELRWDVYVPSSNFQLCLAARDIAESGYPDQYENVLLPKGRYELQIQEVSQTDGFRIRVTQNEESLLDIAETPTFGSNGSSSFIRTGPSLQFDGLTEIDLLRRRFMVPVPGSPGSSRTTIGPTKGVLLWIKPN